MPCFSNIKGDWRLAQKFHFLGSMQPASISGFLCLSVLLFQLAWTFPQGQWLKEGFWDKTTTKTTTSSLSSTTSPTSTTTKQNNSNNNNKYISAITDPISTKLEIITITTGTTTIITKTKTHSTTRKQEQQQISAIDELNQTKLKLGFWIKNNNKAKTMN